jgi:hypothetical protein
MIGAAGHVLLLATGIFFSLFLPDASPSAPELTLRGWLAARKELSLEPRLAFDQQNV